MTKKIVVIGMGYVGIPCAALLADVSGFHVTGVQRRSKRSGWKIDCLNAGESPFQGDEPGLAELIQRVVGNGSFQVTDDISVCSEADVILIDVQTPVDESHVPQYESLRDVASSVGKHLRKKTLVIIESTVAPGTTENVVLPLLEEESGLAAGTDFGLAFSYERVMPGKLLKFITDFPRVVGGIDEQSTALAVELYKHIVKAEVTGTDCLTAETAKTVENAYRDVNIAFANEIALACERMGVDVYEIRELINARPDRNMHIPGAGVGGHCLPKDSWLLQYGLNQISGGGNLLKLIPLARRINDDMPHHMAQLIEKGLLQAGRKLSDSKVAVLGVAYLEDSDDTRNTPALPLIRELRSKDIEVVAHDPHVRDEEWAELANGTAIPLLRELDDAMRGADCAAIVTRHREYCDFDWGTATDLLRSQIVVDGRSILNPAKAVSSGLVYFGVGRSGKVDSNAPLGDGSHQVAKQQLAVCGYCRSVLRVGGEHTHHRRVSELQ
jgi:UDP-N-acetyl-D-mannosaminuronic acid dehydrogenase